MLNPYDSVYHLFSEFGILKRAASTWRLTADAIPGHIHGLEAATDGHMLATDGVHCLILRQNPAKQKELFEGHINYFVTTKPDNTVLLTNGEKVEVGSKVKSEQNNKIAKLTKELIERLLNHHEHTTKT